MNGELAQLVALTCHANAALAGRKHTFFPEHPTCQFCKSVTFVGLKHRVFRSPAEVTVAQTPDAWFALLATMGARGVALTLRPKEKEEPGAEDRMLAGFVGGSGDWGLEAIMPNGHRQRWVARWETDDREAPDQKIWRVTYAWVSNPAGGLPPPSAVSSASARLERALVGIRSFAERQGQLDNFADTFKTALECLKAPPGRLAYPQDPSMDMLPPEAANLLQAAECAWVFGGMGSWNDLGFEGETDAEYRRVSDNLFLAICEAIIAAANASLFAPA